MGEVFRVLVVEDEPVIRELLRSMLSDDTVEVDTASTGEAGLKLARSRRYELILLDIVLPMLDGISICRLLKAEASTRNVPLYMLTAKSRKSDVETALEAGAQGYIHKPFRGAELLELVRGLKERRAEGPAGPAPHSRWQT